MNQLRSRLSYANVMATLAVFIALGGGAYAVTTAPKNSVTSKSIKKGAVKSVDAKNDGLKGIDIDESTLSGVQGPKGDAGQQGPPGPTAAGVFDTNGSDPVASPDSLFCPFATLNAPTSGRILVMLSNSSITEDCSVGDPDVGLYVDGAPVPDTKRDLIDNTPSPAHSLGITAAAVAPGDHLIRLGVDCPDGDLLTGMIPHGGLGGLLLGG
jgi:hypothetical protein